ncbi:MAG TPA: hypothetical protein PKA64_18505, partial [Myxococcota bacterium]|nr:hypothetical protein [Myxococcota bacterium]
AAARGAPGVFAPSEDVHAIVCERLHLAPIRFGTDATWPDDSGYSVHTPAIVVDAALAYVGGQTLAEAEHAAFGLWIDDAPWTARFMSAIWSPLWEGSRAGAVSGEGACTF